MHFAGDNSILMLVSNKKLSQKIDLLGWHPELITSDKNA